MDFPVKVSGLLGTAKTGGGVDTNRHIESLLKTEVSWSGVNVYLGVFGKHIGNVELLKKVKKYSI